MSTKDQRRDEAGREAYEANLRDNPGFASANARRWDVLDQETKDYWIDQAESGDTDDVTEPTATGAEKPAAKTAPAKAAKSTGAKADGKAADAS